MNALKLSLACLASAVLAAAAPAQAHGKLLASEPVDAAFLTQTPAHLRLTFSEAPELAFSKVTLAGANDVAIALSKPQVAASDAKTIDVDVPPLKAGDYQVQWSIMTRDGHKTHGKFGFKVN